MFLSHVCNISECDALSRYGLKTLLLDGNPLGSAGLDILSQGIALNDTITTLGLNECDFRTDGMLKLLNVLRDNAVILKMETKRNRVTHDVSAECHAEIEANNCVLQLTSNAKSVDANKLSEVVRVCSSYCGFNIANIHAMFMLLIC